jgi:hypothetical protein
MAHLTPWRRSLKSALWGGPLLIQVFSPQTIDALCQKAGHHWRSSFWSPSLTLITFLLQVLDEAKTLRAAVATLLVQLVASGRADVPSCDPAAYCQARQRLPAEVPLQLLADVAKRMQDLVSRKTSWLGHRVWVVDGSGVSTPDTPELQAAFPQPSNQKKGCGFPVVSFVALFCWTTGAIIDLVIGSSKINELTLFRRLWDHFGPGDVVLGDRLYNSYVDMARLRQRGVFCVSRLHTNRKADFRKGKRLGRNDRLVTWAKQDWRKSCGMTREEFKALPDTLMVRLVKVMQVPRGCRTRTVILATTLLDPLKVPADEIAALYRDRWTAELNLRYLKTQLGMDVLRGKTPEVVRKEITMHLLSYNLIRLLMWQAARQHGRDLHRLSFTGTMQRLRMILPMMMLGPIRRQHRDRLLDRLFEWIASDLVPDRPDRFEPRCRKRRPKNHLLLTKPRAWYHRHHCKRKN